MAARKVLTTAEKTVECWVSMMAAMMAEQWVGWKATQWVTLTAGCWVVGKVYSLAASRVARLAGMWDSVLADSKAETKVGLKEDLKVELWAVWKDSLMVELTVGL